jgi:uncharacterized tellurite resistance protein B-like protein
LDLAQARYLATFAYVLSRVANADLEISDIESEKMVQLIQHAGHLPEDQAILVVTIAKSENRLFGGTEDFLVTREFREIATDGQRRELLDCLFAVAAADDTISTEEESHIRQIASELGFDHAEFVAARLPYSKKRSVFHASDH